MWDCKQNDLSTPEVPVTRLKKIILPLRKTTSSYHKKWIKLPKNISYNYELQSISFKLRKIHFM